MLIMYYSLYCSQYAMVVVYFLVVSYVVFLNSWQEYLYYNAYLGMSDEVSRASSL